MVATGVLVLLHMSRMWPPHRSRTGGGGGGGSGAREVVLSFQTRSHRRFNLARQISSDAVREEYLNHVCHDQTELQQRVHVLLAATSNQGGYQQGTYKSN